MRPVVVSLTTVLLLVASPIVARADSTDVANGEGTNTATPDERKSVAQPSEPGVSDPVAAAPTTPAAEAQQPAPAADTPAPSEAAKEPVPVKPPPPPYSLPWQLRPVIAPTVVRSDTSVASYEDRGARGGMTIATGLIASYKIPGTGDKGAGLAVLTRLMMVTDSPPATPAPAAPAPQPATDGGLAFVNPLIGGAYAMRHGKSFRSNLFFGVTLPIGQGGGASPDKGLANSRTKGVNARAGMDNALFAVNDVAFIPGVGFAYVDNKLTAQVEATVLHLVRTRGEAVQPETTKTNFTTGVHVGYFFTPFLSAGTDIRYQRWINAPQAVDADTTGATRDNLTAAIGPRFHINAGSAWIRPGIAYWRGLDKPLAAATPNYHAVQIDIPVLF